MERGVGGTGGILAGTTGGGRRNGKGTMTGPARL